MFTKTLLVLACASVFFANAALVRRDTEVAAADATEDAQVQSNEGSAPLSKAAERLSKFLERSLGKLESHAEDEGIKNDVEELRQGFRDGKFNETFERVANELGVEGGHLSPSKIFDSFTEQAPEGFRAMVQRIRDYASSHFERLAKYVPKFRAQIEETARQAFSSIADLFAN